MLKQHGENATKKFHQMNKTKQAQIEIAVHAARIHNQFALIFLL